MPVSQSPFTPPELIPLEISTGTSNSVDTRQLQQQIHAVAPGWLESRFAETPVLVGLPNFDDFGWKTLFRMTDEDIAAERYLPQACRASRYLGITPSEFVRAEYLQDAPPFAAFVVKEIAKHGWTEEHVDFVSKMTTTSDDLRHRMRGAAGWLVTRPEFLAERDRLKTAWEQLPAQQRPPLPWQRSLQMDQRPDGAQKAGPSKRLELQRQFDQFCDRWQLLGMITWELPGLHGPKWTNTRPGQSEQSEGGWQISTPFHFPLQVRDDLGTRITESHTEHAASRGYVDQSKWETYAQLLRLSFWENVIDQRYAAYDRVKAFVTNKMEVLANLLDLNPERTRKLRTLANKLRSGTRADLREHR